MEKNSFSIKNIDQGSIHEIRRNLVIVTNDSTFSQPCIAKVATSDMVSWLENECADDLMDKVNFFTLSSTQMQLGHYLNEGMSSNDQVQVNSLMMYEPIGLPVQTNILESPNFGPNQTALQSSCKQVTANVSIFVKIS